MCKAQQNCYLKAKIYILKNTVNDKIYVGSTCDTKRRLQEHKKCAKNYKIRNKSYIKQ